MADPGQGVVDAAKNLTQGPIDTAQGAAAKAGAAVESAADTVGTAANSALDTAVKGAEEVGNKISSLVAPPQAQVAAGPQPKSETEELSGINFSDLTAKSATDLGIGPQFQAKQQEMQENAQKIGAIQNMPPAARAKYLKDNGVSQKDIDGIQQELGAGLLKQQGEAHEASQEAEKEIEDKENKADELAPVAKTLMGVAAVGMAPAVAAEGITAATAAGVELSPGLVASQIVKTYAMFKMAGLASDGAKAVVDRVFPNAGWKTRTAVDLVANLAGFAAGGKITNQIPWVNQAIKDIPEAAAALEDHEHMMSEPVGLKHVTPEVMEGPPGASKTAKDVTPEAGSEEAPAKPGEGVESPAKGAATPATPEEQRVEGLKKAGLPVKLVSAQEQAGKMEVPKSVPAGGEPTPELTKWAMVTHRAQVAEDVGIIPNETITNEAINRRSTEPLSDGEQTRFQLAHDVGVENILKLANAHIKAMARGDQAGVGAIGDLFTHESAKLNYLDEALGKTRAGAGSIPQETAKDAIQSSQTLETIANQQGTPAERTAKAEKIMGWQKYASPANVAVAATLYNPKLWLAKAVVDLTWAPYQNFIKGLSYLPSMHPQDAVSMWAASTDGYLEGFARMWRYGAKTFTTGGRVGEKELGMLNEPEHVPSTYAQDIDESHPGEAARGLESTFNPSMAARLKNGAGMVLNTGGRIILAEDQMAKTTTQLMAQHTAATAQAIAEANEKGIGFLARGRYIKSRADDLMSLMPQDLYQKATNETYQLTFTAQNDLASRAARLLEKGTIPATRFSPEFALGKMIGALFVKTPFNMFKQGAINSPLAMAMPESAGWGAGTDFASRRLAVTRAAVATGALALIIKHSGNFNITGDGPVDPIMAKQRREMGIPDRSIGFRTLTGEQYYRSWEGMGPAATMLSLAANYAESYHSASEENRGAISDHIINAMSALVDHGPLMHQFGHLFEAATQAARGNKAEMISALEDAASTSVKPEVLTDIAKIVDPRTHDSSTFMNRLLQDNPFTRAGVPLKRDHFGYPQYVVPGHELSDIPPTHFETAMYVWNPFHTTPIINPDPVEKEAFRVGAVLKDVPEMFIGSAGPTGVGHDSASPKIGVPYSPDPVENARLMDRLKVLAGHESKDEDGVNQHQAMLNEINSPEYKAMTIYAQRDRIENIAKQYLSMGRQDLLDEDDARAQKEGGLSLRDRMNNRSDDRRDEYYGPGEAKDRPGIIGVP